MDFLSQLIQTASTPYEPQLRVKQQRMCGAAALVMAYRNCGLSVPQREIWNQIAEPFQGEFRARTFRMAADAIKRNLACAIIQTHQPWRILNQCWRNNISVILNHRIASDSTQGHYSLLAGLTADSILIHDPLQGPSQKYGHAEFQKLWLPNSRTCEISGNIMLAIARLEDLPSIWCHCDHPLAEYRDCQSCGFEIPLQPAVALGCWNRQCRDRAWWKLFCPGCDQPIEEIQSP